MPEIVYLHGDCPTLDDGRVILVSRDAISAWGNGGCVWSNGYDWSYILDAEADDFDVTIRIGQAVRKAAAHGVNKVYVQL